MKVIEIPIEQIDTGTRYRTHTEGLADLAMSMKSHGLINPITLLRQTAEKDPQPSFLLITGGRRLQAAKKLGWTTIPSNVLEDVDEMRLRILELEENIRRENMSFVDECALKARIHELQTSLHGIALPGGKGGEEKKGWRIEDTAKQLGESTMNTSRDLRLAQIIESNPDIAWEACKNKSDALKLAQKIGTVLTRKSNAQKIEEAAKSVKTTGNGKILKLTNHYVLGDFFEKIEAFPDGFFDFIEIDPPYAIDLKTVKKDYSYTDAYNEIEKDVYEEFIKRLATTVYKKAKPNAWFVCWFAQNPWYSLINDVFSSVGFTLAQKMGIWYKIGTPWQTMQPKNNLASAYETFVYGRKGTAEIQKQGRADVFAFKGVNSDIKIHPTERPEELLREVLLTFCLPYAKILVPFAGSGATILAAYSLGMEAFGFDLAEEYRNAFVTKLGILAGE